MKRLTQDWTRKSFRLTSFLRPQSDKKLRKKDKKSSQSVQWWFIYEWLLLRVLGVNFPVGVLSKLSSCENNYWDKAVIHLFPKDLKGASLSKRIF